MTDNARKQKMRREDIKLVMNKDCNKKNLMRNNEKGIEKIEFLMKIMKETSIADKRKKIYENVGK